MRSVPSRPRRDPRHRRDEPDLAGADPPRRDADRLLVATRSSRLRDLVVTLIELRSCCRPPSPGSACSRRSAALGLLGGTSTSSGSASRSRRPRSCSPSPSSPARSTSARRSRRSRRSTRRCSMPRARSARAGAACLPRRLPLARRASAGRRARVRARDRRVRRDDHVRRLPPGRDPDAPLAIYEHFDLDFASRWRSAPSSIVVLPPSSWSASSSPDGARTRLDPSPSLLRSSVALTVEPGRRLALVGPSGAGKTTVLRVVAGLLRPAGDARLDGVAGSTRSAASTLRPSAAASATSSRSTRSSRTSTSRKRRLRRARGSRGTRCWTGSGSAPCGRHAARALGRRAPARGARSRARPRPDVLLLDEPVSALDARTRADVAPSCRAAARARLPAILVTHDFEDAATLATSSASSSTAHVLQSAAGRARGAQRRRSSRLHRREPAYRNARPGRGLTVVLDAGGSMYSADGGEGRVGARRLPLGGVARARRQPADSAVNHVLGDVARSSGSGTVFASASGR